jgi:serine/threonine protein kinase
VLDTNVAGFAALYALASGLLQVLGHVSRLIQDLHGTGYVHRDLKPGNIMWEPHTSVWVLIDFGLVASIGSRAPVGFTPTYAAPEAAQAYRQNDADMLVTTELDAWALGVIALEIVLQKPPFGRMAPFQEVSTILHLCFCFHSRTLSKTLTVC